MGKRIKKRLLPIYLYIVFYLIVGIYFKQLNYKQNKQKSTSQTYFQYLPQKTKTYVIAHDTKPTPSLKTM